MAVYYKFKSAKDYDSIPIDGHFISVANLKERIFESKHLGRGTDFDLVVTNAQTNEEYLDEAMLIPKNTSVLIRRVPGRPRMPIVAQPDEPKMENSIEDDQPPKSNFTAADTSVLKDLGASEWDDEFGNDLYATIPEVTPGQSGNPTQDAAPPSKADEDSKIKALVENSVLDWQRQPDGFGAGRGFGRGGRVGRGFGRGGGLERKTPPQGYVCHRCKIPGHFIQHCPTNGDPNYDIKKVKPPTGIPKSMLVPTPDGSYALPSGTAAVLKPNEAAFEKEIEGLPSTRSVGDLPPELHCPLCKEVMKDAVLTSKCCFNSFCDKCIRDYIMSKSMCVCGARDILADDLLPNRTLRDTINRILESGNSSADNAGSALQVQDLESARCPQPKIPSPSQSAASKGEHMPPPRLEETPNLKESAKLEETINLKGRANGEMPSDAPQQQVRPQISDKGKMTKVPDASEATHESASVKEPASQSSALPVEEEVQQKAAAVEAGKKKKKKKRVPLPVNGADMQWMGMQPGMDGYMGPSGLNPYWPGVQPPMDGFMGPFPGPMPYNMGYGVGPMDMPFGNVMPHDPFVNVMPQGFMFPPMVPPPQRDLAAEFGLGMNVRPPMSREEFEARKAEVRRKREMERRVESREPPKDRDYGREVSSNAVAPPMKSRPKPPPVRRSPSADRYEHERDIDRRRERASLERYEPERDRDRGRERASLDRYEHERERERGRERASLDRDRDRDRDHDRDSHLRRSSQSHRLDRISPDRSSRDVDIPRPSLKRKSDSEHEHDHHRERDRDRREHHRRSDSSSSKPPPSSANSEPPPAPQTSSKTKPSVFSRISFPDEEPSKKRKVSDEPKPKVKPASKDHEGGGSGSGSGSGHRRHHKPSSSNAMDANGYHETARKSVAAAMDYESSDDERHFKRRPSRYEPSPSRGEEWTEPDEEVEGRRHSRDRKHR